MNLYDIPQPVFQKLKVEKKKNPKLFRKFGEVRIIKPDGTIKILRPAGLERVHKRTYKK
ncbi:MAG: hypothetical protein PVG65_00010 [Candidatus Thorarchaeota archaeon]|jgi:hypothetical protein